MSTETATPTKPKKPKLIGFGRAPAHPFLVSYRNRTLLLPESSLRYGPRIRSHLAPGSDSSEHRLQRWGGPMVHHLLGDTVVPRNNPKRMDERPSR